MAVNCYPMIGPAWSKQEFLLWLLYYTYASILNDSNASQLYQRRAQDCVYLHSGLNHVNIRRLAVPRTRYKTRGAGLFLWSDPDPGRPCPPHVSTAPTVACFKSRLKTHFYSLAVNTVSCVVLCVFYFIYFLLFYFSYLFIYVYDVILFNLLRYTDFLCSTLETFCCEICYINKSDETWTTKQCRGKSQCLSCAYLSTWRKHKWGFKTTTKLPGDINKNVNLHRCYRNNVYTKLKQF